MLTIGLVIATLMASVRQQTRVAGARERRTALLYAHEPRARGRARCCARWPRIAVKHVAEVFDCEAWCCCRTRPASSVPAESGPRRLLSRRRSRGGAVGARSRPARRIGVRHAAAAPALYLPLGDAQRQLGVLAVLPQNRRRVLLPEQLHLLETFAGQIGLALERARLAEQAETARVAAAGRESAQHAARLDLARSAHAARRDGRRRQHARRSTARRSMTRPASSSRAVDRDQGTRDVGSRSRTCSISCASSRASSRLRRDWETVDDLVGGRACSAARNALAHHAIECELAARPSRRCSSTRVWSCKCSSI